MPGSRASTGSVGGEEEGPRRRRGRSVEAKEPSLHRKSSVSSRAVPPPPEKRCHLGKWLVLPWLVFGFSAYLGYAYLSNGSLSSIITLGAALHTLGYLLLLGGVVIFWKADGIAGGSLLLSAVALVGRLYTNVKYDHYLPADKSGDWLYQVLDAISLWTISVLLCFFAATRFGVGAIATLHRHEPSPSPAKTKNEAAGKLRCFACCFKRLLLNRLDLGLLVVAYLCALRLHAERTGEPLADTAWALALYLDAMAFLPQLFWGAERAKEPAGGGAVLITRHALVALFLGNGCSVVFWYCKFQKLAPVAFGWAVLSAAVLRTAVVADCLYRCLT